MLPRAQEMDRWDIGGLGVWWRWHTIGSLTSGEYGTIELDVSDVRLGIFLLLLLSL